jgi:hypothetical protein
MEEDDLPRKQGNMPCHKLEMQDVAVLEGDPELSRKLAQPRIRAEEHQQC